MRSCRCDTAQLALERFTWGSLDDEARDLAIPVIPLDPESCANWAQMQMAAGAVRLSCLLQGKPRCPRLEVGRRSDCPATNGS